MKTETTMQKVFQLFVGGDELRPAMLKPFEINGMVYATDAHSVIRAPKASIDFELDNEETPPKADSIYPEPNTNRTLKIDKDAFESLKTEPETRKVECKVCEGKGEVLWEFKDYSKEDDCPECDGDGGHDIATGNYTFDSLELIKLNTTYFNLRLFYKLIQTQELLGGEIMLTYQTDNPNDRVMFRIAECEIIVMPVMIGENSPVVLEVECWPKVSFDEFKGKSLFKKD